MIKITEKLFRKKFDAIWGIGGGSTMDVAKIASVSIPSLRKNFSLEQILDNKNLLKNISPINTVQIPTTAGTGSEVTPFATIWDYNLQIKRSLSHESLYSKKAIIDSNFLNKVPEEILLSTGLDALNQALESIWNKNANEITKSIAINSIVASFKGLNKLSNISQNKKISDDLALASLLSGLCISQTRTALCHSISYPLTLKFNVPHGIACAFSMLEVLKFNAEKIKKDIKIIENRIDGGSLQSAIINLFEKYNFYERIRIYLSSSKDVLDLLPEMVSSERSGNNIKTFSNDDVKGIIYRSCQNASIS